MKKREGISFAEKVKEESARSERDDEEKRSLLSSFIRLNGYLSLREGNERLDISSESSSIAKAIYQYLHDLYGINARFAYTRSAGFLKRIVYHVLLEKEPEDILNDLGIDFFSIENPKNLVMNQKQIAAYLTGTFLAKGSINSPKSSSYHLELSFTDPSFAKWVQRLLTHYTFHSFNAKMIQRRNHYVVYLKRSDEISDFLILLNAKSCCLEFENVRVERDFANVTNRLSNLDTANYAKTLKSSEIQVEQIHYFVKKLGWDGIGNEKLKALMKLRLEHPDASLNELAHLLSEELNTTVSRSNINHLFRYLSEQYKIAQKENKKE